MDFGPSLFISRDLDKEYAGMVGNADFCVEAAKLLRLEVILLR